MIHLHEHRDTEFECDDFCASLSENLDQPVFFANRYANYSTVYFHPDLSKSKDEYLDRLVHFYLSLKLEGTSRDRPASLNGVHINRLGGKRLSLDALATPELIKDHHEFRELRLLRIDSPYLILTMEDFSQGGWKPETGKICLISHLDISKPAAQFIAENARYKAPAEELEPILAKIYQR